MYDGVECRVSRGLQRARAPRVPRLRLAVPNMGSEARTSFVVGDLSPMCARDVSRAVRALRLARPGGD